MNLTYQLDNQLDNLVDESICSDFDYDCFDSVNHLQCFLGNMQCEINNTKENIGLADGLCPFLGKNK